MTLHFTPLKKAFLVTALFIGSMANAQYYWDAGFSVGAANYLGDMGGNVLSRRDFVSDMKMSETHMSVGGFFRYKLNPWFSLKTNLAWSRISGDDKLSSNPGRNGRNLNFRNDVIELATQVQFTFYQIHNLGRSYRHQDNFKAYIGLGVGMAYHNPKALYDGVYIPLRGLKTENVGYSKVAAVIPMSGGFYFTFDKNYRIGLDLSWRTTFTDYLDDVSSTYADPSVLPSGLSAELANRTDELTFLDPGFAENFTPGNKRGDASHNDSYLTSSVEFSYVFRGRSVTSPRYPWLHKKRDNRPSKYDGPRRKRYPVRKIRLKW
jgi:hypothetical protein